MNPYDPNIAFSTHIALPMFLAGFLLLGSGISYYLYKQLEEKIYLSLAFFQFWSFLHGFFKAIVIYNTKRHNIAASLQYSRLEELTVVAFLIIIPWLLRNISRARLPKITKFLIKLGIIVNCVIFVIAFVFPDLFVSVTKSLYERSLLMKDIGKGEKGLFYYIRDIFLGAFFVYSLIFLKKVQKDKSFLNFTKWIYTGAILTVVFSVMDLLEPYLFLKNNIFPAGFSFPYSVIGLSMFGFFIIIGEFRMFMQRIKKKQEYLRVLVNKRAKKLNEEIEKKEKVKNKLEEEKEKAIELAKQAKKANRKKSNFMNNISHEMRTPMNGVLGMAQILQTEDLNQEQKQKVEIIYNAGKSLMHIIENLLDLSEMDWDKNMFQKSRLNLKDLILSIKNTFELRIKEKNINFQFDYKAPEFIIASENSLYQIIMNLIDNAVKFNEGGEVSIEVSVNEKISDHKAEFAIVIEDNSESISSKNLKELLTNKGDYDEDLSVNSNNKNYSLIIVKKLVQLMQGDIELDSRPEKGSRFIIYLPLQIGKKQDESEKSVSKEVDAKILVVDDTEEDKIALKKLLQKKGCEVDCASNGMEAIDILEDSKFNMIFVDLMMPKLDGFEIAEVIKKGLPDKIRKTTFIIGLTSRELGVDKQRIYAAGINDYIMKPIDENTIESILNEYSKWIKE